MRARMMFHLPCIGHFYGCSRTRAFEIAVFWTFECCSFVYWQALCPLPPLPTGAQGDPPFRICLCDRRQGANRGCSSPLPLPSFPSPPLPSPFRVSSTRPATLAGDQPVHLPSASTPIPHMSCDQGEAYSRGASQVRSLTVGHRCSPPLGLCSRIGRLSPATCNPWGLQVVGFAHHIPNVRVTGWGEA